MSLQLLRTVRALALGCVALAGTDVPVRAATGHDLWLRYVAVEEPALRQAYARTISAIVTQDDSSTGRVALAELRRGLSGLLGAAVPIVDTLPPEGGVLLGTPAGSPLVAALGLDETLGRLGEEGYLIRSTRVEGREATVIASSRPCGVLYGVFHLLRLIQTRQPLTGLDLA
ncbi:MAG TPA: alpha-glucuronidase family glycosyl hydrolase, partial [Vicinamibacteria bacterium]